MPPISPRIGPAAIEGIETQNQGRSILEVLLDEGVDVDYSCELGICGACEQRIISGIAEHHDSILSEEEQAENKRVMICCAGSKSERLVLDM